MAWLENFGNEVFVREMRFNTNPREKNWKCNDTSFLNSKGILFLAPIKIKKVFLMTLQLLLCGQMEPRR